MTEKPVTQSRRRTIGKVSAISIVACLACFAVPIFAVLATAGLGTLLGAGVIGTVAMIGIVIAALQARQSLGRATNASVAVADSTTRSRPAIDSGGRRPEEGHDRVHEEIDIAGP